MTKTFDYLSASIGPVVEGLEDYERIYALNRQSIFLCAHCPVNAV